MPFNITSLTSRDLKRYIRRPVFKEDPLRLFDISQNQTYFEDLDQSKIQLNSCNSQMRNLSIDTSNLSHDQSFRLDIDEYDENGKDSVRLITLEAISENKIQESPRNNIFEINIEETEKDPSEIDKVLLNTENSDEDANAEHEVNDVFSNDYFNNSYEVFKSPDKAVIIDNGNIQKGIKCPIVEEIKEPELELPIIEEKIGDNSNNKILIETREPADIIEEEEK